MMIGHIMIRWEMTCKVNLRHVYGLELGWNTCLCEILYTLSSFPYLVGPSVSSNAI